MILITTSIDNKFELDDDIILLGDWCKGHSILSKFPQYIKKTSSYHWEDREVFFNDSCKVIEIYEKLLPEYSKALNNLHNVNYSIRFWRIIIGPWLLLFIGALFDRWSSILNAQRHENFDWVALSIINENDKVIVDMLDFYNKSAEDSWNNNIFSEIIKNWTKLNYKELPLINKKLEKKSVNLKTKLKALFYKIMHKLSIFSLKNEIIFIDSYIPSNKKWALEILLGQIPSSFYFDSGENPTPKVVKRSNLMIDYQPQNKLEEFIISLIPDQIPQSYIENFDFLLSNAKSKKWPQSPKIIFTANAHFANEQFKYWAAIHSENEAQLFIGQHGGGIGTMKIILFEYIDKMLGDKYITWGWDDINFSNIIQLPSFRLVNNHKRNQKKGLLHVMDDNSRYSRAIQTTPVSSLHIKYLDDQYIFSNKIDHNLIEDYEVRNCPNNHHWEYKGNWHNNVLFDSNKNFFKSLYSHKLIVISSNGTTLLEALAGNIPTVIFWNTAFNEIRDESKNDFDNLKNVGILFDSPELAAIHINSIWSDIAFWWESEELQLARIQFCYKYARTSKNSLIEWKSYFEQVNIG